MLREIASFEARGQCGVRKVFFCVRLRSRAPLRIGCQQRNTPTFVPLGQSRPIPNSGSRTTHLYTLNAICTATGSNLLQRRFGDSRVCRVQQGDKESAKEVAMSYEMPPQGPPEALVPPPMGVPPPGAPGFPGAPMGPPPHAHAQMGVQGMPLDMGLGLERVFPCVRLRGLPFDVSEVCCFCDWGGGSCSLFHSSCLCLLRARRLRRWSRSGSAGSRRRLEAGSLQGEGGGGGDESAAASAAAKARNSHSSRLPLPPPSLTTVYCCTTGRDPHLPGACVRARVSPLYCRAAAADARSTQNTTRTRARDPTNHLHPLPHTKHKQTNKQTKTN